MQATSVSFARAARPWLTPLLPLAVALAVPQLLPGYFAAPLVLHSCAARQATVAGTDGSFSVTQFSAIPPNGDTPSDVPPGATFCGRSLSLAGTATAPPAGQHLRLFNVDDQGRLFVHEPPLAVVNGRWQVANVGPGSNIHEIRFLWVSEATSHRYSANAAQGDWGPHSKPPEAQTVASIPIQRERVCAALNARDCAPG